MLLCNDGYESGVLEGHEPCLPSLALVEFPPRSRAGFAFQHLHSSAHSASPIAISQQLGTDFIVRAAALIWSELELVSAKGCRGRLPSLPSTHVRFPELCELFLGRVRKPELLNRQFAAAVPKARIARRVSPELF